MKLILTGPTAVGKTSLSIKIARALQVPIISADSRQCYKYLNIGTSTPTLSELSRIPHFNISCLEPGQKESVSHFQDRVATIRQKYLHNTSLEFFTGGSTLYVQSLFQPLDDLPPTDPVIRDQVREKLANDGIETLKEELERIDPEYAVSMDGFNTQRICRALEIYYQTGKPFSSFHSSEKRGEAPSPTTNELVFVLTRNRDRLYDRINRRVFRMTEMGLLKEVEAILNRGYSPQLQSLNTVGYKEPLSYLRGEMNWETMIHKIQTSTRRYAKRQLTWFRRWKNVTWIDLDQKSDDDVLHEVLRKVAAYRRNS